MAEAASEADEAPKKKTKLPLIIGLVLMLVLGGGGFFAVFTGMILGGGEPPAPTTPEIVPEAIPDIAFIPLDPMVVSMQGTAARHLRFTAQLEVSKAFVADVELLKPRVMDVLNGYLRAVDAKSFEEPGSLVRLRAQMLRRVQIVTGEGRVRDLLVIEFVLN
ncbi:flagellar basal body-associated protein FliL [Albirhodobacter sp. R86504]|uniref:flagellar basal body-associated FliL family protein n=1 Tax=Albirhodobacter sp. R86504 TaxID=3093848 RepID=UPI003671F090